MQPKNEKEQIELATAEKFLRTYNLEFNTNFIAYEISDAPDILCKDIHTNEKLALEITLHEDLKGEITYLLGRRKDQPKSKITGSTVRQLEGDSLPILIEVIKKKLTKDYGKSVALVVRQVSPIPWTYDIEFIKKNINILNNPFDKGIWLLTPDLKIIKLD
ncbi:hypothetical protein [Bacillus sp. UMB0893]|uniref:hypothetical protein n=1 Tax=Bacillus sp. UMB0893 TaxID=2066053 RepID=UPI000C764CEF|nr:hypothetical protein [Bacillus sp. UMB0893]PLR69110.1 hypothetical protein CYJ36_01220 [Bacillus sp. UMB0893]